MKKAGLLIMALGATVLGYYIYDQYTLAKKFTYSITGIQVQHVSGADIQFLVGFKITNQSNFSAHITNVDLQAYIGKVMAGTIQNNLDIIIPANGTGNIQVIVTVLTGQIEVNAISLLTSITGKKNVDLNLVGNFTVKTMLFPIKIPIKYSTTGQDLYALYKENFG